LVWLGALFIAFGLYIPTRQKLDIANADLEHANAMMLAGGPMESGL